MMTMRECIMRNLRDRTTLEHQKRGRESEAFAMAFLFDSAEVEEIKRARNTGPRTATARGVECSGRPGGPER